MFLSCCENEQHQDLNFNLHVSIETDRSTRPQNLGNQELLGADSKFFIFGRKLVAIAQHVYLMWIIIL